MPDHRRYSCQVSLPGFNIQMQECLQQARVLIVGAGGLGCPAAQYLAAMGIGTLGIADPENISESNLHRQILYSTTDIGKKKALVACEKLQAQNTLIDVISHQLTITTGNVMEIISQYDIIVDCTDNFESRYLLNDACVICNKPLVYGAIYQYEGQVAVWNVQLENGRSPNYRDVYPSVDSTRVPKCSEGGVLPTVAGIIGCLQANEVIKLIGKSDNVLAGKLMLVDVRTCITSIIDLGEISNVVIDSLTYIDVPHISPIDLKKLLSENKCRLVDVRTQNERNHFNLGGDHINLNTLSDLFVPVGDGVPVVFYCETGRRSTEAVKELLDKYPGSSYFSLQGGIRAWNQIIHG